MLKPFLLLVLVTVNSVVACPTWFQEKNGTCECGSDLGGTIMCNNYTKTVAIVEGYCMSYNIDGTLRDMEDSELVVGFCFARYNYAGTVNRVYHTLDSNQVKGNCTHYNLEGFFCGECEKGYGLAINSLHTECVNNCNRWGVSIIYITCVILPISVFFLAVLLFRPNIPSGPMLGYILYCQGFIAAMKYNVGFYTSLLDNLNGLKFSLKLSLGISGVWWYFATLLFGIPHQCFSTDMSSLAVISLQYIYVLYPLLLVFITWLCIELHARDFRPMVYLWKPFHKCFAKVRRKWSVNDSVIHAYATFFFLSFVCLTYTSFQLLYTTSVYNINGTSVRKVLVHEPSIENFSTQHLPYAIPAILLLFFLGVCPALFLCIYPIKLFRKCCYRCTIPRFQLTVNFFIETFRNCYKDGLNGTYDFRFLSSAPFILFLSFVLLGTIHGMTAFSSHIYIVGCISVVFIILAIFVSYVRPFKSLYSNFSFSFHFTVESFMIVICVIWYEGHMMSAYSLAMMFTCFSLLPHIFALATLVHHILRHIRFFRTKCERLSEIISAKFRQSQADIAESLPDRLQNSSAYKTLSVMH